MYIATIYSILYVLVVCSKYLVCVYVCVCMSTHVEMYPPYRKH